MPKVFISSEYSGIDHRRGTAKPASKSLSPGGIFGQRKCPSNTFGIFESYYAIPNDVEQEILTGGLLDGVTGKPLPRTAQPIARNIRRSLPGDPEQIAWGNQNSWRAGDLGAMEGGAMPDKTGMTQDAVSKGGSSDGGTSSGAGKGGGESRGTDAIQLPGATVNRGLIFLLILGALGFIAFTQE